MRPRDLAIDTLKVWGCSILSGSEGATKGLRCLATKGLRCLKNIDR